MTFALISQQHIIRSEDAGQVRPAQADLARHSYAVTWRLGRRPGLDGLRGVAILLVLLCHFDNPVSAPFTAAGVMGVTIFFTLSGFLITALLLAERDRSGRVDLAAFYRRRAVRLLPALVAMLLAVVVIQREVVTLGLSVAGTLSSLFYVANWWGIAHPGVTALSHTWSLSIEEQFYFLWPLVVIVAARWGRRVVLASAVAGSLLSFALLTLGWSLGWADVSQRSDTRASSLLVGCALAAWMHGRTEGRSRPAVALGLLAALLPMTLAKGALASSLMVTVPLATAGILWATAQGSGVRLLEARWLRWVGQRSYGLYVWHFPVMLLGFQLAPGADWRVRSAVCLAASFAVTVASWRWVEQPFMRLRSRPAEVVPHVEVALT